MDLRRLVIHLQDKNLTHDQKANGQSTMNQGNRLLIILLTELKTLLKQ